MSKPWEDPKVFIEAFDDLGSWKAMADKWTQDGNSISETSVRRIAENYCLHLGGTHRDFLVKAISKAINSEKAAKAEAARELKRANEAVERAKLSLREAQNQNRTIQKSANDIKKDLEKKLEKAANAPREAEPTELLNAERRIQLYQEKVSKLTKVVESQAKNDNIIEVISDILTPIVEATKLPAITAPVTPDNYIAEEALSLFLSLNDIHWGENIEPETINGLNAYSPNIAARRLEHVVDVTKTWANNYRRMGEVDELVILLNGDNFSGMHQIHPDEANEYARIAVQATDCALVTAQTIWELAHEFPKVRIIAPAGDNHTRSTRRNATSVVAHGTSWSTLYHELIASFLVNLPNVEFQFEQSYQVFFDIKGYGWAACHGHGLKGGGGALGIPAYALKRLHDFSVSKNVILAKNIDWSQITTVEEAIALMSSITKHTIIGHFHQQFYAQFNGGDVRISPSLKGQDAFANDMLAKYSPAGQTLLAIHPKHDVIADHTISCQHIMEEGDTRYYWGTQNDVSPAALTMKDWTEAQVV